MVQESALLLVIGVSLGLSANLAAAADAPSPEGFAVFSPPGASWLETLAAREVRRYVYLRTGQLLPVVEVAGVLPDAAAGIVVAEKGRPVVAALTAEEPLKAAVDGLGAEHYLLKTLGPRDRPIVLVTGGDGVGTLYGAYRLAEHLGVRFYLHSPMRRGSG